MGMKERLESVRSLIEGTALDSRLPPAYPPVAIEIDGDSITGVRVAAERKSGRLVVRHAVRRDLPAGAMEPSLVRPNILDEEAVGSALDEVLKALGPVEHRVSLLVPDQAARVALLGFNALPGTRSELFDMVRFRMAKSLPFRAEEAALDVMPIGGSANASVGASAGSVLAVFMHRPVLEQYETLLKRRGRWPGLVGLSTLELFNLFRGKLDKDGHDQDQMLLNLTRRYLSLLILSQGQVLFYRCKPHPDGAGLGADFAGLRREIYTSLAFYQEKLLGRGIGRIHLRVAGMPQEAAAEAVRSEGGAPVELLDLAECMIAGEGVTLDAEMATLVAAAVGGAVGRRP
jgi:hypothetical protein